MSDDVAAERKGVAGCDLYCLHGATTPSGGTKNGKTPSNTITTSVHVKYSREKYQRSEFHKL